mmetsp:Transcript_23430/g.54569  ORF Transcript_23430/g.54569 Transcript_23430/m.54569 type:complete len:93 (+) Transcript_23430:748-1026(+)
MEDKFTPSRKTLAAVKKELTERQPRICYMGRMQYRRSLPGRDCNKLCSTHPEMYIARLLPCELHCAVCLVRQRVRCPPWFVIRYDFFGDFPF